MRCHQCQPLDGCIAVTDAYIYVELVLAITDLEIKSHDGGWTAPFEHNGRVKLFIKILRTIQMSFKNFEFQKLYTRYLLVDMIHRYFTKVHLGSI